MNISTICIIITIVLLRKIFLYKIPSFIFAILWGLAFVRLVIPFDITTNYNFYNGFFYFIQNILHVSLYSSIFLKISTIVVQLIQNKIFLCILLTLWLSGVFYVGKKFVVTFLGTLNLRRTSTPMKNKDDIYEILESYGLSKKYLLCENENIVSPVACGILKPMIIFPKDFSYTHSEISDQALLHEYMHLKYHHQVIQYILIFIVMINWFNPFSWLMYHYINRDMEVACDRGALKVLGKEYREIYAVQLVHLIDKDYHERPKQVVFYNSFSKYVMKERIVAIMRFKKFSITAAVVAMLIPLGTVSAFGASPRYMFGSDLQFGKYKITMDAKTTNNDVASTNEFTLSWEEIAPYVTEGDSSRAADSLYVAGYKVVFSSASKITDTVDVSVEREGYIYKGTLYFTHSQMEGSKCIAYYSGTLYR